MTEPPSLVGKGFSHLTSEEGSESRQLLGRACPRTHDFLQRCEFISLGCYCAVSKAFVHLGIRQRAYPFDWARSSIEGVIHCFETDFEDFLTYTDTFEHAGLKCCAGTRWGGSFWHHDIEQAGVQEDFHRRIDRLLGLAEIPPSTPRVFVRLLNSSRELDLVLKLKEVLQASFPSSCVYLLVIVDLQDEEVQICLEALSTKGILIHFLTSAKVYADIDSGATDDLNARSNAYAESIFFAAKFWATAVTDTDQVAVRKLASMADVNALCTQYHGGDTSRALYGPQYFHGCRVASQRKPRSLPKLLYGKHAEFFLPESVEPGSLLSVTLFDNQLSFRLPQQAAPGMKMKCSLVEAILSATLHPTDAGDQPLARWQVPLKTVRVAGA